MLLSSIGRAFATVDKEVLLMGQALIKLMIMMIISTNKLGSVCNFLKG